MMQPDFNDPTDVCPATNEKQPEETLAPGLLPVPPGIQLSQAAFRRNLPQLLQTHYRQWVAYHGNQRIGFGRSKTKLIQECLRRGIPRDQFVVCSIEPESPDEDKLELRDL